MKDEIRKQVNHNKFESIVKEEIDKSLFFLQMIVGKVKLLDLNRR